MTRAYQSWLAGGVGLALAAGIYAQWSRPLATPPTGTRSVSRSTRGLPGEPPAPVTKRSDRPLPAAGANALELPPPVISPHPPGSAANRDWLAARIAELDALAWFDDPESLHRILAELRNPLPEIRTAALAATRAFGSREAIPYLERISIETPEAAEQKALTELVEYLKIPTLREHLDSQAAGPAGETAAPPAAPATDDSGPR